MIFIKNHKSKAFIFFGIILFISVGIFLRLKTPCGVDQFKTIKIGMEAVEKSGTHTIWAPPDDKVPNSDFYVYAIGDESMCIGADCGIGGYFVECLGGYLSGYSYASGEVDDYGLRDAGVDTKKIKIITIADKDGKVVGIYPDAKIKNVPYILSHNHKDLILSERLKICQSTLPSMWK